MAQRVAHPASAGPTFVPAPPDIRTRVERLLAGDRRQDDLHRLFQWLRHNTYGRAPAVKDVGDFVAHRDERNAGISWERGRDFLFMTALTLSNLVGPDLRELSHLRNGAMAALRAIGPEKARSRFKKPYRVVKRILESALDKVEKFENGNIVFKRQGTQSEIDVLTYYSNVIAPLLAFDQEGLSKQLSWCLIEHKVMDKNAAPMLMEASGFVALYAIAHMHGALLLDEDIPIGRLTLGQDDKKKGNLAVGVTTLEEEYKWVANVFETNLNIQEHCTEKLLSCTADFDVLRLELDGQGKLTSI